MTVNQVPFLAVLTTVMLIPAASAQFGGMPELPAVMPGTGGSPSMGGAVVGGSLAPIPPACQKLLALRAETLRNATAIRAVTDQAHGRRKPPDPVKTCGLFEVYLASDSKFIRELQHNAEMCGVIAQAIKEAQDDYGKASEAGKQICNAPFIKWDSAVPPSRARAYGP